MSLGEAAMAKTVEDVENGTGVDLGREAVPGRILAPHHPPHTRILYFPDGVYRVTDTLVYGQKQLHTTHRDELNRCIHFLGTGSGRVTIRLDDHCPGFSEGEEKPVVQFQPGRKSAVAMQNSFEGITIEVGAGNPGAIGLNFFANNTGIVRDVCVRSTDPLYRGRAGVAILDWNSSCALLQDLEIEGFDIGFWVRHPRLYTVVEDLRLTNQREAGIWVSEHNAVIRQLKSNNSVPALKVTGASAVTQLIGAELRGNGAAIEVYGGQLMGHNLDTEGMDHCIVNRVTGESIKGSVKSYCSHATFQLFKNNSRVPELIPAESPLRTSFLEVENWTSVEAYGALGDGVR